MGSESTPPSSSTNLTDEKPQTPGGVAMGDIPREASPPSVFVNSEPLREDQILSAVKFLTHPSVRGSPVVHRRAFLEKKGLTREEIDEAFRRAPDPSPTVTTPPVATPNPGDQSAVASNLQPLVAAPSPQLVVSAPSGIVSRITHRTELSWSRAIALIAFLFGSGVGITLLFKNSIIPRFKSWIGKTALEEYSVNKGMLPSVAEETAAAAKAASAAAADVAKATQEMLNFRNEDRKLHEALYVVLDVQTQMRSLTASVRRLESLSEVNASSNRQFEGVQGSSRNVGPSNNLLRNSSLEQDDVRALYTNLQYQQQRTNGSVNSDLGSVRSSSAPVSNEPPHPKQFSEIMAMIQRGEKPPGIKEINDLPPNPNQPPSNPRLAPRIKPWETNQNQEGSYYGDITNSRVQDYPPTSQFNGDRSELPWQQKNVRITEVESEDETRMSSSRSTINEQQTVRRAWVPPQPPPIAMPEAAAAIRQTKPSFRTERLVEEEKLIARPSEESADELQRVTKLAESGGEVENNNYVNVSSSTTEIQEERADFVEAN